jgi:hypothetical protein
MGRRSWVKVLGGAAGAGLALTAGAGELVSPAPRGMRSLPWPYGPLDPDATGERAFRSYLKGHCMYGTFDAVVGQVAERLGEPYASFPFDMFVYGAGGVQGWATLCGALNGCAAAFQLLAEKPEPLTDALFAWYEREALPDFVPKAAKLPNVPSVAGSPLCHASISSWCAASGKKSYSAERKERCGVLTASVARRAVQLLDLQRAGKALPVALDEPSAKCAGCHEHGGVLENTRSKMACGGCHFHLGSKHPDT